MDDYGKVPKGIQFDVEDSKVTKYPELWLEPTEIKEILQVETEKEDKKLKAAAKKEEKKARKKKNKPKNKPVSSTISPIPPPTTVPSTLDDALDTPVDLDDLDGFDMNDTNFLEDLEGEVDVLDLGDLDL